MSHLEVFNKRCELDVYNLTDEEDNQQNDLAFMYFSDSLNASISDDDAQDFFVPTLRTWDLHDTDAFIFVYPLFAIYPSSNLPSVVKQREIYERIFPLNTKVIKHGKVFFRREGEEDIKPTTPPIVGVHTCGAINGMEGSAMVSMKYPGELIGIRKFIVPVRFGPLIDPLSRSSRHAIT